MDWPRNSHRFLSMAPIISPNLWMPHLAFRSISSTLVFGAARITTPLFCEKLQSTENFTAHCEKASKVQYSMKAHNIPWIQRNWRSSVPGLPFLLCIEPHTQDWIQRTDRLASPDRNLSSFALNFTKVASSRAILQSQQRLLITHTIAIYLVCLLLPTSSC